MRNYILVCVLMVAIGAVECRITKRGGGTGESCKRKVRVSFYPGQIHCTPFTVGSSSNKSCPSVETLTAAITKLNDRLDENCDCRCRDFLVSGEKGIPDSQLSASSVWPDSFSHAAHRGRLFDFSPVGGGTGAWVAGRVLTTQEYIQASFTTDKRITGIVTQGRREAPQWVASYKVLYSSDGETWTVIQDTMGDKVFNGNYDSTTPVINLLDPPVIATYVRVQPQTWIVHISMRFEVLGCAVEKN